MGISSKSAASTAVKAAWAEAVAKGERCWCWLLGSSEGGEGCVVSRQ